MDLENIKSEFVLLSLNEKYKFHDWIHTHIRSMKRMNYIDEFNFLWYQFATRLSDLHSEVDIISGRDFLSGRYRALVVAHAYEEWVKGITYREMADVVGLHWSALSKSSKLNYDRAHFKKGVWDEIAEMDAEILTIYNQIMKD